MIPATKVRDGDLPKTSSPQSLLVKGFTLIELLFVIAIIAILAGMLLGHAEFVPRKKFMRV